MEDEKIEQILKGFIKTKFKKQSLDKTPNCPPEEILNDYLYGYLSAEQEGSISNHIAGCPYCLELLEQAQGAEGVDLSKEKPPRKIVDNFIKFKFCPHCGQTLNGRAKEYLKRTQFLIAGSWLKKNLWLLFSVGALILSFIIHKFFMQFIALSAILGIKWAFDTGAKKSLVMIYQAWRKHTPPSEDEDIEEILKSRQNKPTPK